MNPCMTSAWSSTREPEDVFMLLETLYRNFDKVAVRRKVYKVETIGKSSKECFHITVKTDIVSNLHFFTDALLLMNR